MPLFKVRVQTADPEAGRAVEAVLGGLVAPVPLAVTLFETRPGCVVEAYYEHAPSTRWAPLGALCSRYGHQRPIIEAVPDANWVALSQQRSRRSRRPLHRARQP